MTSSNGVVKTQLANGLTVLLKPMHHAPVASFWVWYRVGSRNEHTGITGSAHWVEHMMFKGTPQFPTGAHDQIVSREGGRWNAFTWIDFTAYFETLPADRIDLALRLEADRMRNTVITAEATESERSVILSERHMYENQPTFLLFEEVQAAAFRVHPYHHEVIGDEADLRSMSRDDLVNFYQQHYAPNNAIAIAVGDFDSSAMLAQIEQHFGDLEPSQLPTPLRRSEPPQKGERRVDVHGPGDTRYFVASYKAPEAAHDDYYALALLNAAFAGGGSLGMFGGSTTNKSSRLYQALVASEIAVGVQGSITPTIDPFLYSIVAVAHPQATLEQVETALDAELARLATEPLSQEELAHAIKRTKVSFVKASESITGQAQMLGMSESVIGDYRWFEQAIARFESVTLADIDRVRDQYLRPEKRTIGRYLPHAAA